MRLPPELMDSRDETVTSEALWRGVVSFVATVAVAAIALGGLFF